MISTQTGNDGIEDRGLRFDAGAEGTTDAVGDGDASLEETAAREREYLRGRLRDELGREPNEEELDEWLRKHTEGY